MRAGFFIPKWRHLCPNDAHRDHRGESLSDYVTGTITLTTGEIQFTGASTGWLLAGFKEGDTIIDVTGATEFMGVIASITDNTTGTLTKPWEGPTITAEYRMRYLADGQRVTAQARNLIELLGNGRLTAIASAPETVGVIEMLAGGAARLVPLTDLVSGANYDVQVANMAARAAFDGETAGFAVLVADTGDGRAAIFSKLSNASGDWSAAAYVTGPVGPPADVTVGATVTGAPGTPALVTPTPTPDGVELEFTIPAGEGFTFVPGGYNPTTAFNKGDVVRDNNSAWIALQATTGNAPPVFPATSNAYWELLAAKGADGTGTGDMVGPASATDGAFVGFDGLTGKLAKELSNTVATSMLNTFAVTLKGLVPAPSAGDITAGRILSAGGTWIDAPNPAPLPGSVVNSWTGSYSLYFNGSAPVPVDDTPPLATEGVQLVSIVTGALRSASNKIRIRFSGLVGATAITAAILSIHVNGNAAARTSYGVIRTANDALFMGGEFEFSPGATTSLTISLRAGAQTANLLLNGTVSARLFGGALAQTLVVEEIAA